jgi:hypothetical protein
VEPYLDVAFIYSRRYTSHKMTDSTNLKEVASSRKTCCVIFLQLQADAHVVELPYSLVILAAASSDTVMYSTMAIL